jgi:hypothetical protein
MRNPVTKEEKLNPPVLLIWVELTEMLYALCSITLKGPSQLEESLWSPSRFSTPLRTRSPTLSSLLCTDRWW